MENQTVLTSEEFHLLQGLGARAIEIYLWLGLYHPTNRTIATSDLSKHLGIHLSNIHRALDQLIARGLIEIEKERIGYKMKIRRPYAPKRFAPPPP